MRLSEFRARLRARERLHNLAEASRENRAAAQRARWRRSPIRERTVFYESFNGNGVLDNPEAIFRHLLSRPEYAGYDHVWSLDPEAQQADVRAEFADDDRVTFVEPGSGEYHKALATSKYLVSNATFPQEFAKRAGQVYLNTWHGLPLKYMGFDTPLGGIGARNVTRNFLQADYLLSTGPYMTDTMYRRAFRLQGILRGAVLEEGMPRTDRQHEALADPAAVVARLEQHGVRVDGRRIVLFCPTWRGASFQDPNVNAAQLVATVRELQAALDPARDVVLLKVHQVIYNAVRERLGEDCDFLVPNEVPTNLTLGVTDLMVTDYSSIFFDFVGTGRPVVHYVPDLEEYRSGRGLYLDEDELPGRICETVPELVEEVRAVLAEPGPAPRSVEAAERFSARNDGSVCRRVVDLVFGGAEETSGTVRRDFGTEKETVLVYLGSMMSMGITSSALSLLRNMDYEKYDVTAFWVYSNGRERAKNAAQVDPRVRSIPRANVLLGTPKQVHEENEKLLVKGLPDRLDRRHLEFWGDEWRRLFGETTFDHLIDFSGYGSFSAFLFSATTSGTRSIWLHSDMDSDMRRETAGEQHLGDRLRAVFSTYKYFDNLVSVSPELARVNSEKLADYARPEQFKSAINTLQFDRVLERAAMTEEEVAERRLTESAAALAKPITADTPHDSFPTTNVAAAVSRLMTRFPPEQVLREVQSRVRLQSWEPGDGLVRFVTVGRLSPEKNHVRMIRAFAQVHEEDPRVRLLILGGGKLLPDLAERVLSEGMEPFVTLAGQVDNPYSIMAHCDCFVLSSDYEGQPMVLLEARALGLPLITTAFASVGDSVGPDAGIIVPRSVKGVADGMRRFLAGEVPTSPLDTAAYNRLATAQFAEAIGAPGRRHTAVPSPVREQVVDHAS